jgi:xanthine dehydrogenase YagR molybdenum-binding subunit
MNEVIGKPIDRVDGKLKLTGAAKYSAEFSFKNLAHGYTVQSTITKGRIKSINTEDALKLKGVIGVMTYKNSMSLSHLSGGSDPSSGKLGEKELLPLQSDRIFYNGQHIAVVIANTFELAEYGASLIKVEYEEEKPSINMDDELMNAYPPGQETGKTEVQATRGDFNKAFQDAQVKVEETYSTPVYHHNAMEPHATIADWKGDQITIYDSTQSVNGSRNAIAQMLGMQPDKIRLISLFIGGGFGSKGFTWPHSVLAPMASKFVGRPIKIVLDRQQMFTSNGRRSLTIQKISLGADKNGLLTSTQHATISETSYVDEFVEAAGVATKLMYTSPNMEVKQNLVKLNRGTPCPTRAPGEAVGTFAMEVAMDELAIKLNMDPMELRLVNYAEIDPQSKKPWSSKYLRECYKRGAELIGWSKRNPVPRSTKEGNFLVGYGMATSIYSGNRTGASAKVRIFPDGHVVAACGTQDIGTGTYTILTQIISEILGIPVDQIEMKLGDTLLPKGPNSGGSQTSASAGPAVRAAALDAKSKVIKMAIADKRSPLYQQTEDAVTVNNNELSLQNQVDKKESYAKIISRSKLTMIEGDATISGKVTTRETQQQESNPAAKQTNNSSDQKGKDNPAVKEDEAVDRKKYSFQSFGAQFVKVLVDPSLGTIRVAQCVGVMDIGKVLNLKTAKNQIMGGMTFALGMALMEETIYDEHTGRIVTRDLANYLVPVNADIPEYIVEFIDKPDPYISPIGSRGIGEIGITGLSAAIANAVYNATGKRIRSLPLTLDKLI